MVESRQVLAGPYVCRVESLPGDWEEIRTKDGRRYKLTVKGDIFGASWVGRIDIFAPHPFRPGDVVRLTEMVAIHRMKAVAESRATSGFTQSKGGPESVTVTTRYPAWGPAGIPEEATDMWEERAYIRMDDAHGEDPGSARLVTLLAASKVTLKGFGRQYRHELRGEPLWQHHVFGGVRSGRTENILVLAIVDDEHPLAVETVFDHQGEKPDRGI